MHAETLTRYTQNIKRFSKFMVSSIIMSQLNLLIGSHEIRIFGNKIVLT